MKTFELKYHGQGQGWELEDSDGQYVDVEIIGDRAFILYELEGDEKPTALSCHASEAASHTFNLMGITNV